MSSLPALKVERDEVQVLLVQWAVASARSSTTVCALECCVLANSIGRAGIDEGGGYRVFDPDFFAR